MQHYWSLEDVHLENAWLTIGSFDGVHRGHQEIVRELTSGAHQQGLPAVVLTFHPHPAMVLGKRKDPFYLTTPMQRAELLEQLGVDVVVTHPFNLQVAAMSAHDFMSQVSDHLHLQQLWVGYDFALGHGREGNVPKLRLLGEEFGYQLQVISPVEVDGQVVSSSLVRSLLSGGNVEEASRMLGRPYRLEGEVVPGDGRGRLIGVPTANMSIWSDMVMPKAGVYVCHAIVNGYPMGAVTNVGVRPTFETEPVPTRVEAHIIDFNEDIYGQHIQLDFLSRLRDEQRYPTVQALVDQMQEDIHQARVLLEQGSDV